MIRRGGHRAQNFSYLKDSKTNSSNSGLFTAGSVEGSSTAAISPSSGLRLAPKLILDVNEKVGAVPPFTLINRSFSSASSPPNPNLDDDSLRRLSGNKLGIKQGSSPAASQSQSILNEVITRHNSSTSATPQNDTTSDNSDDDSLRSSLSYTEGNPLKLKPVNIE